MVVIKVFDEDLVIYINKGILIIFVLFDNIFWFGVVLKFEEFYLRNMVFEILFGIIRKGLL